jgi:hypothetical protein
MTFHVCPSAQNGTNHSSGISNPNPGASLGTSQPSLGIAWPGSRQASSNGTPGGVPTKHSHHGADGVAYVKYCTRNLCAAQTKTWIF